MILELSCLRGGQPFDEVFQIRAAKSPSVVSLARRKKIEDWSEAREYVATQPMDNMSTALPTKCAAPIVGR